ncbi:LysR family transcriptional regulator [Sinomonas cellulolyticus]|uniref:LysR family transcriptional regulator n=1 Tax=Sinomonas cellulolyticus TaxID=2801916 RepID=A0ABS1JY90_9MICC|nr:MULTISPECIES: LysR family transcriptional regulator [Sinomonas]MBL0704168.1 LysR family transcriptional regulator [Sinomonas cellulolyticus]GHG58066.1 LysR family transcriptional regulator [Sinomonas sp. KCTC 49339]
MPEFTLRQLEYFVAVLDAGSVTDAARRSNVSQAAASMAIGQLERALGVDLFIRSRSKRLVPTQAGAALGARARRILADAAEVPGAVRSGWEELKGSVRIGCMIAISPRLIPPLLADIGRRWPEIELSFVEGAAEELQRAVMDGELDAAFVYSLQTIPGVDPVTIAESRPQIMLAESHPLAQRSSLRFADLAEEDAVLFDVPPSVERVQAMFQSIGVEPRVRWKSVVAENIRGIVSSGRAYSVTNVWKGMEEHFAAAGVVTVPVSDPTPPNYVVAAVPPGLRRPRRVEAVLDAARSIATGAPDDVPPDGGPVGLP